jgi:hypothetical protein
MSLELKIEELTKQVAKLTEVMTFLVSNPATAIYTPEQKTEQAAVVETAKSEPVAVPAKTVNADDVTGLCLSLSRRDPANKLKIKDLLTSYKASKVSDLSETNLAEFAAKLEQL